MNNQYPRTHWLWLFLLLPLMMGLGYLDIKWQASDLDHRLLEIAILILIYGLVNLWISAHPTAFIEQCHDKEESYSHEHAVHKSIGEKTYVDEKIPVAGVFHEPVQYDHTLVGRDN